MELLCVLLAVLLGVAAALAFGGFAELRPRWAGWLLAIGAGAAAGIGLSGVIYFLFAVLLHVRLLALAIELAALAASAFFLWRRGAWLREATATGDGGLQLTLWATVALLLIVVTLAFAAAWQANPQGNWDAWAIWNLRARYLAAGDGLASRAWSPALGTATHPEYPLLLSSFVAGCWAFSGTMSELAPIATSYVFFLALLAMVTGGIAALRGPLLGLAAGLVLLASPAVLREVPAQYADVPLSCYMAGAVVLAMLDRPLLAGILAGFATFTKDEGLLFAAILVVASAVFRRRAALWALAGALPVAIIAIVFKLSLPKMAASFTGVSSGGLAARATDFSRAGMIIAAFGRELIGMSTGWYHPVLPLIALVVACGVARERREALYSGAVAALLLAGYGGVFLVTGYDLKWQLDTALGRLLVQAWPLVLVAVMAALKAPQVCAPVKARRKQAR